MMIRYFIGLKPMLFLLLVKAAINKINIVQILSVIALSQKQQQIAEGRYHDGKITG
jgi:hypothetical protein